MARTVVDAAMLHAGMLPGAGARSGRGLVEAALEGAVDLDLTGQRIGVVAQMAGAANAAGVRDRFWHAMDVLERLGADVVEVSLPAVGAALEAYYVISSYESLATLSPYSGTGRLGAEAQRRLLVGNEVGADPDRRTLDAAWAVADGLRAAADAAWGDCTLLAPPTLPVTAPLLGNGLDDPLAAPRTDCWTVLANLTGIAALSLPAGDCPDTGLPVGVQLMAPHGADARLYRVAASAESALTA